MNSTIYHVNNKPCQHWWVSKHGFIGDLVVDLTSCETSQATVSTALEHPELANVDWEDVFSIPFDPFAGREFFKAQSWRQEHDIQNETAFFEWVLWHRPEYFDETVNSILIDLFGTAHEKALSAVQLAGSAH